MDPKGANRAEVQLAEIASNQHGVISLGQLRMVGVSADAARHRARRGRLHRVHRGIYAVGHAGLSNEGRWMAAVLAVGTGAVLSHRSAAALWRLMPPLDAAVEVSVPRDSGRKKRPGITIHRSRTLTPRQTTSRRNIPVTTPARTLEDLRHRLTDEEFNTALRQAEVKRYRVDDVAVAGREPTSTELERRFMALCRRHRLPLPEVNAQVGKFQADFLWRDAKLIAETDGYATHRGRGAFELDHARATELAAAGFEVLRFTWRQIVNDPRSVATALRMRLG